MLTKQEEKILKADKKAIDKLKAKKFIRTLMTLSSKGFRAYSNKLNLEIKRYAKQKLIELIEDLKAEQNKKSEVLNAEKN